MENEVRKRDEIISQLQKRIQELERLGLPTVPSNIETTDLDIQESHESSNNVLKQQQSKNTSSGSDDNLSGVDEGFMVTISDLYVLLF